MGERKRAYIAFALACQPSVLLMDEPTNGLDIPSKECFGRLIASYTTPERTIVISTHHTSDIQNLIDNLVILDRDGVILNQSIEQICRRLYFGAVASEEEALWRQEQITGWRGVVENHNERESIVDLELLFLAATHRKEQIKMLFNR